MSKQAKVTAITNARVVKEVVDIQGSGPESKLWTPEKQKLLLWNVLRSNPSLKFEKLTADELKAAWQDWCECWDGGRLAYPSNTARGLAAAGLAAGAREEEFDLGGVK